MKSREALVALMIVGEAVLAPTQSYAQSGFLCGFASITDPTVEGDVQTGEIDGGPLFAADTDHPGEETADISIRCTVQVGAQGAIHAGADAYSAEGPTNPGVAVLPAHQFSYVAPSGSPVYVCTEAEVNGQIRYFNETEDDATRGWSTSSSSACALAISQEVEPPQGEQCRNGEIQYNCDLPNGGTCPLWWMDHCVSEAGPRSGSFVPEGNG